MRREKVNNGMDEWCLSVLERCINPREGDCSALGAGEQLPYQSGRFFPFSALPSLSVHHRTSLSISELRDSSVNKL